MEDFAEGESVMLTNAPTDTLGRIVAITNDGRIAQVRWERRPGFEHQVTDEYTASLRRLHESDEGMLA